MRLKGHSLVALAALNPLQVLDASKRDSPLPYYRKIKAIKPAFADKRPRLIGATAGDSGWNAGIGRDGMLECRRWLGQHDFSDSEQSCVLWERYGGARHRTAQLRERFFPRCCALNCIGFSECSHRIFIFR